MDRDREHLVTRFSPGPIAWGLGILLACWGISLLLVPHNYARGSSETPPHIGHDAASTGSEKPTPIDQPRNELTPFPIAEHAIKRQVTQFFSVRHENGEVVTGWDHQDGFSESPIVNKFCYFSIHDFGAKNWETRRIDLGRNGVRLPDVTPESVPDLDGAVAKCHWSDNGNADPM